MTHYYAWYYSNFQCFQDNEIHVINHMRLAQADLQEFPPANSDIIQIIVISPLKSLGLLITNKVP